MDDDKKKKRNKKKKNKQAKTTEYVAVGADENQVSNGHDSHSQASEMAEIQNAPLDLNRHQSNGAEGVSLAFQNCNICASILHSSIWFF